MTSPRSLVDIIAQAITEAADPDVPGIHAEAMAITVALPPADREALSIGLLLAEVDRRLPRGFWELWRHHRDPESYGMEASVADDGPVMYSTGDTPHAALAALLAQLETGQ